MDNKFKELEEWFKEITYNMENYVVEKDIEWTTHKAEAKKYYIYTQDYVYCITAVVKNNENERDYLGCVASCRKSRVGETWTRGSDLPDGEFNKDTWDRIVRGILRFEILKLDIQTSHIEDTIDEDVEVEEKV